MAIDTEALVTRASRGDVAAVDVLLEHNLPALRAYVRLKAGRLVGARESLSDLVQSVCREVLEDLDDFEYRGEVSFRAWLFRYAYHKIVDRGRFYRAAKRDARLEVELNAESDGEEGGEDEDLRGAVASFLTPSRHAMGRERMARVEAAFGDLAEDQREAILLQRIVGIPYEEIARQMERSEGAVRNLVYRGLARLSMLLEDPDSSS